MKKTLLLLAVLAAGPSQASAQKSGFSSRRILSALFANPKIAEVFSPFEFTSGRRMNA